MTEEEIINQGRDLVTFYEWLKDEKEFKIGDKIDKHNVCTAYIKRPDVEDKKCKNLTLFAYSNPTNIKKCIVSRFELVTDINVDRRLINIENIHGSHTEIKLINYIFANELIKENSELAFFSLIKECKCCRDSIEIAELVYRTGFPKLKDFRMFMISETSFGELWEIDKNGNVIRTYDIN